MEEHVRIRCTYFKYSGKYYCSGEGVFHVSDFKDCIYPKEYGQKLNNLEKLPGLHSGTWDAYFTV
jgi:hypothetical protein